MKFPKMIATLLCAIALGFSASGAALAASEKTGDIRVIASVALKQIFIELFEQFEKQSGRKIELTTGGTVVIMQRVEAGEPFDMVVLASSDIDKLIESGKIRQGSRVDLVKSKIAIAIRKGAKAPDISTGEAVKQTVLNAKTIGYSAGPSGVYMLDLFQRWGIADQIKSRLVQVPPGAQVGAVVARGEAELGFHQVSEFLPVEGITIVGPMPDDIQRVTVFSGGITSKTEQQDAVKNLLKFLTSPEASGSKLKNGMDPA